MLIAVLALLTTALPGDAAREEETRRPEIQDADLMGILDPSSPMVEGAMQASDTAGALLRKLQTEQSQAPLGEDELWNQQLSYGDRDAVERWLGDREIEFPGLGFGPWVTPREPDWGEDPFANQSWRTRYLGLGWLMAPLRAYERSHREVLLDEIKSYVFSWIEANGDRSAAVSRAWYDHAVALRTDMLVFLYQRAMAGHLTDLEYGTLLHALAVHGEFLRELLDNPSFRGHNHGIFHAMALYNLTSAFPFLRPAAEWRAAAVTRLRALLDEMTTSDGVTSEQAISYHYLAMNVFAKAATYLAVQDPPLAELLTERIKRMADFGALIISPAGTVPAIGDTNYGAAGGSATVDRALSDGLGGPWAEFVATRGESGRRPDSLVTFRQGGYVIARPSYGDAGAWSDDLQLVMDVGPARRVHGHEDALSFTLHGLGVPLLIDPGGPYLYGSDDHERFVRADAHNTVTRVGTSPAFDDVRLESARDSGESIAISASVRDSTGLRHRRTIVIIPPGTVIVADEVSGEDSPTHLRFHLPPQAVPVLTGPTAQVSVAGVIMRIQTFGSSPLRSSVISGANDPIAGWVTPSYARKEAAPVLDYEQAHVGWFATFIRFGRSGTDVAVEGQVIETTDGLELRLPLDDVRSAEIFLPRAGAADVRVVDGR